MQTESHRKPLDTHTKKNVAVVALAVKLDQSDPKSLSSICENSR